MDKNVIEKINIVINEVSGRYHIPGYEHEDLLRVGGLYAVDIIKEDGVDLANFAYKRAEIKRKIEYLFSDLLRKAMLENKTSIGRRPQNLPALPQLQEEAVRDVIREEEGLSSKRVAVLALRKLSQIALKTKAKKDIREVVFCLVKILKIDPSEAPSVINYYTFVEYSLQAYLWEFFKNSPYKALHYAYPFITADMMGRKPNRYWKGSAGKRRALEELRRLLLESDKRKKRYPLLVSERFFQENGLSSPYQVHFNSSPYLFLNAAFPGEFFPWQMAVTSKEFINDEWAKKAVKWVVEEKLKIPLSKMDPKEVWEQGVSNKVTKQILCEYGLRGYVAHYGNCAEKLLRLTYPDKFQKWDFQRNGKWAGEEGKKLAAEATRWVIEEYAGLDPKSPEVDWNFFLNNGLHGMITSRVLGFNSSPTAALKNAYPELKFKSKRKKKRIK